MKNLIAILFLSLLLISCNEKGINTPNIAYPVLIKHIKTTDLNMTLNVVANKTSNTLLVHVYPSYTNTKGGDILRNVKMDNTGKLVLSIDNKEQVLPRIALSKLNASANPFSYSDYIERYDYGIELPLDEVKDAQFRLKLVRTGAYQSSDNTVFRLPSVSEIEASSLSNGHLDLTELGKNNRLTLNWSTSNYSQTLDYKARNVNETCTFSVPSRNTEYSYKRLNFLGITSGDSKRLPDINKRALNSSIIGVFGEQKQVIHHCSKVRNNGSAIIDEFVRYQKAMSNPIDTATTKINISCKGNMYLSTSVTLNAEQIKNEKIEPTYQTHGDSLYRSSKINIQHGSNVPYSSTFTDSPEPINHSLNLCFTPTF